MLPDFHVDVTELAYRLVDIPSPSHQEKQLVDQIEAVWTQPTYSHLEVYRSGQTIVARTNLGRPQRVVVAGHIDTVPVKENGYAKWVTRAGETYLWGRGSVDMKGGVACLLHASAQLKTPKYDVTWVVYDCEEVEARFNGLQRLVAERPDLLAADLAIIGEPTAGQIEAGCNGTLRVVLTTRGVTAHSARAWRGHNAIHEAYEILRRLAEYQPRTVEIDGLGYREGLNATWINGGVAKNSIPDRCEITINYRFAPHMTGEEALNHVKEVFSGIDYQLEVDDLSVGALPGLDSQLGKELLRVVDGPVKPKYGWTDVARFTELGIPALNFGPGDPLECHTDQEACATVQIRKVTEKLLAFLSE